MSPRWELYGPESIDGLAWPGTADGQYARQFLFPFIREGADRFMANVETRMLALRLDDLVLPVTVNEAEYGTCYVCSPYSHYVHCSWEEARRLPYPGLPLALGAVIAPVAGLLRAGQFNRAVHVNNWLLSTNLYPTLSGEQLAQITGLHQRFPEHAIILRSLNDRMHPAMLAQLQGIGYKLIPSRQVWLHDVSRLERFTKKARYNIGRDTRLLAESGYRIIPHEGLTPADIPRLRSLYAALYLEKYSAYNPDFTEPLFDLALRTGIFRLTALEKGGRIDGVIGYFARGGAMTAPVVGYDTGLPAEAGLYRMLGALLIREARRLGLLIHDSAGAASFKRWRGAVPAMEYSAVYDRHLPAGRRLAWTALGEALRRVAVPLMRRYQL